jgi:hypothetical protein
MLFRKNSKNHQSNSMTGQLNFYKYLMIQVANIFMTLKTFSKMIFVIFPDLSSINGNTMLVSNVILLFLNMEYFPL